VINNINSLKLDSRQATYKKLFVEKVEEYIEKYKLKQTMERLCNENESRDQIEMIDKEISYILDKARRQVEGLSRGVPYLEKKMKSYSALKY